METCPVSVLNTTNVKANDLTSVPFLAATVMAPHHENSTGLLRKKNIVPGPWIRSYQELTIRMLLGCEITLVIIFVETCTINF